MSSSSRSLRTKRAARSVYILPPPASSSTLPLPVYFSSSMGLFPVEVRPHAAGREWPHYRQKPEQRQGARHVLALLLLTSPSQKRQSKNPFLRKERTA